MAITIGSKGLEEVNLVIPQGTSLSFEIDHVDEEDQPIDHTSSVCKMAFQTKDKGTMYDLSEYCSPTATGFLVSIPKEVTIGIPETTSKFKLFWDLIVYTNSYDSTRVCYGDVTIIDTYALDGE